MLKFGSVAACTALILMGGATLLLAGQAPQRQRPPDVEPAHPAPIVPHDAAAYAALAKLPDWSGAWLADPTPAVQITSTTLPLAPKEAAQLAQIRAKTKPGAKPARDKFCRPLGIPLSLSHVGPLMEVVYAPGHIFFNSEAQENRDIHTDGRPMLAEADIDSFAGFSIGHWEGDTLVIESIGFLDDTDLVPGIKNGGGLKVSERIRLVSPTKLEDKITLSGAKALTKPYTYTVTYTRHKEWAPQEYVCLTESHAIYNVDNYKPTQAEDWASTDMKPPVRIPAPPAKTYTQADWEALANLPDWYGFWNFDQAPNEAVTGEFIPLTADRKKYMQFLYHLRDIGGDTPSDIYHCRPRGAPQMMKAAGAGYFFAFTPWAVYMEPNNSQTRRFWTDGRPHPQNVELSFNGNSVAHWEGDTLVVDTVGLRPDVQMFYGMPEGNDMHMVERYHLIGPDKMQIDTVQESKVALTEPWSTKRTFSRKRDWDMLEDYCAQNNRDVGNDTGMQTFDLTPPPELQNSK